jgi:hypothetical protein
VDQSGGYQPGQYRERARSEVEEVSECSTDPEQVGRADGALRGLHQTIDEHGGTQKAMAQLASLEAAGRPMHRSEEPQSIRPGCRTWLRARHSSGTRSPPSSVVSAWGD